MTPAAIQDVRLPKIGYLRSKASEYGTEPYWFGLGFIQLKLNDYERMHFWCPEIPRPEREEIHNHRYDFVSKVLAGSLHHSVYHLDALVDSRDSLRLADTCEWEIFETDCQPGKEGTVETVTPCMLSHVGDFRLSAGSLYELPHTTYHTTENTDFAITHLIRSLPKILDFASVIKQRGQPTSCPFKDKIPAAQCWEYIDCALERVR
jgi:hypothetical protein